MDVDEGLQFGSGPHGGGVGGDGGGGGGVGLSLMGDVKLWLTSNLADPWSSSNLSTFLTPAILSSATANFEALAVHVKLRLLFSLLTVPAPSLPDLSSDIAALLEVALKDDEEWVRVVASILKPFQSKVLACDASSASESFKKTYSRLLAVVESTQLHFHPLEYAYLSEKLLRSKNFFVPPASSSNSSTSTSRPHFQITKKIPELKLLKPKTMTKNPSLYHVSTPSTPRVSSVLSTPTSRGAGMFTPSSVRRSSAMFTPRKTPSHLHTPMRRTPTGSTMILGGPPSTPTPYNSSSTADGGLFATPARPSNSLYPPSTPKDPSVEEAPATPRTRDALQLLDHASETMEEAQKRVLEREKTQAGKIGTRFPNSTPHKYRGARNGPRRYVKVKKKKETVEVDPEADTEEAQDDLRVDIDGSETPIKKKRRRVKPATPAEGASEKPPIKKRKVSATKPNQLSGVTQPSPLTTHPLAQTVAAVSQTELTAPKSANDPNAQMSASESAKKKKKSKTKLPKTYSFSDSESLVGSDEEFTGGSKLPLDRASLKKNRARTRSSFPEQGGTASAASATPTQPSSTIADPYAVSNNSASLPSLAAAAAAASAEANLNPTQQYRGLDTYNRPGGAGAATAQSVGYYHQPSLTNHLAFGNPLAGGVPQGFNTTGLAPSAYAPPGSHAYSALPNSLAQMQQQQQMASAQAQLQHMDQLRQLQQQQQQQQKALFGYSAYNPPPPPPQQ